MILHGFVNYQRKINWTGWENIRLATELMVMFFVSTPVDAYTLSKLMSIIFNIRYSMIVHHLLYFFKKRDAIFF